MEERPLSRRDRVRYSRGDQGELLVYDMRYDVGHVLNGSAAAVYELADGKRSIAEIADCLAERVGLPADEQVVRLALQDLDEAKLLDRKTTAARSQISRRDVIKQLALVAPAVALLPQMASVTQLSKASAETTRIAGHSNTVVQPYQTYGSGLLDLSLGLSADASIG